MKVISTKYLYLMLTVIWNLKLELTYGPFTIHFSMTLELIDPVADGLVLVEYLIVIPAFPRGYMIYLFYY